MHGLATIDAVPHDPPAAAPELLAWALIRTLVAFDTTSRESNLALIDWVREYLAAHAIASMLTFDDERRVGDRLYGRGVADMKSFCAAALAFVPEFLRRGLAHPLHLALSYDEEVGWAHQPNESVAIEQLSRCEAFMHRLAERLCRV